jgi:hypothetical protein
MKTSCLMVVMCSMLIVLCLAATALSQDPPKSPAEPVGVIVTSGDQVMVNGATVHRGSTVFSGNDVQTGDVPAFVNITSGGGALSVAPHSRVRLSREQAKIIAEIIHGSLTVRSPLASTVVAPGRVITSEPDNLYTVSVSGTEAAIKSLLKPVTVRTAEGTVQTIAAAMVSGAAAVTFPSSDSTGGGPGAAQPPVPGYPPEVTPYGGCFVAVICQVIDTNTLRVAGIVLCNGNPVGGTTVDLRIFLRNQAVMGPVTVRTVQTGSRIGQYEFTFRSPSMLSIGGMAVATVTDCGQCTDRNPETNRCSF